MKVVRASGRKVDLGTIDLGQVVLEAVRDGEMSYAIDQQPFLQGYLGVLIAHQFVNYRLAPATEINSGPFFIDQSNAAAVLAVGEKYPGSRGGELASLGVTAPHPHASPRLRGEGTARRMRMGAVAEPKAIVTAGMSGLPSSQLERNDWAMSMTEASPLTTTPQAMPLFARLIRIVWIGPAVAALMIYVFFAIFGGATGFTSLAGTAGWLNAAA
ncbi:MAG: hypothetical protein KL863_08575 [Rhizobium sp.]|nr:hypothetical protein [Rhizobium sp.]